MINHIKTLLLNEDPNDLDPSLCTFAVDKRYKPVKLTGKLKVLYSSLFPVDKEEKCITVDSLYKIVNRVDLKEHLEYFDTRCEESNSECEICVDCIHPELRVREPSNLSGFLSQSAYTVLYSKTGNERADTELASLANIDSFKHDGGINIAARVLALAVKIDALAGIR